METKYIVRRVLTLVVLALLVASGVWTLFFRPVSHIQEGEFLTMDGQTIQSVTSLVKPDTGVVLLVFWKSDCAYCRQLLFTVEEMNIPGLQVIAVHMGGTIKQVKATAESWGLYNTTLAVGANVAPKNMNGDRVSGSPFSILFVRNDTGGFDALTEWVGMIPSEELLRIKEIMTGGEE